MSRAPATTDAFHAISDGNRRALIHALRGGEQPVGALVTETGMSYSLVSQHLQVMLDAGIATRRGVMCIHREPAYSSEPESDGTRFALPVSEAAQDRGVILPMFAGMTVDQARWVAARLDDALSVTASRARAC